MSERPTLLFLSGASLVGQNLLAALEGRREHLHLAALNSEPRDPALYAFDAAYLVPEGRRDPRRYAERFLDLYRRLRPRLVIPCRDDDAVFLAKMADRLPEEAACFLSGASDTASMLLDKWRSYTFSREHGLPFAETLSCARSATDLIAFAQAQDLPLICKPREGFASRGVTLISEVSQLAPLAGREDLVLQRHLGDGAAVRAQIHRMREEGLPLFYSFESLKLSIQTLIDRAGRCLGVCATLNTMSQGRSEQVRRSEEPAFLALGRRCAEVFAAAGWRGPLNIQCQIGADGALGIYEYNGRFTGATAARLALGFDEIGIVLKAYAGLALPAATTIVGHTAKRSLQVRLLPETSVEVLIRSGEWRRARD